MTKVIEIVLVLFLIKFCDLSKVATFLADFVNKQGCPAHLHLLSCMSKAGSVELANFIGRTNMAMAFLKNGFDLGSNREMATFVMYPNCSGFGNVMKAAQNIGLFNSSFCWIMFAAEYEVAGYFFGSHSKIFLVSETPRGYNVTAIFKHTPHSTDFLINRVGLWTFECGFQDFRKLTFPATRIDLQGRKLRGAYYFSDTKSLDHLHDDRFIEFYTDHVTKVNHILLVILTDYLNATYVPLYTSRISQWSLFFHLNNGDADISGMSTVMTESNWNELKFVGPTAKDEVSLILKTPALSTMRNIYSMPLSDASWYCLAAILGVATINLYCIAVSQKRLAMADGSVLMYGAESWTLTETMCRRLEAFEMWTYRRMLRVSSNLTLSDVIMFQLSALFSKSFDKEFENVSGKIASGFLYVTLMIISVFYSASIVVFLQATKEVNDISTLARLDIKQSTFDDAVDNTRLAMPKRFLGDSEREGIRRVRDGGFAYKTRASLAYYLIQKSFEEYEKCSITAIDTSPYRNEPYLPVPRNSCLMEHFQVGFRRMFEHGLHRREYDRFFTKKPKCREHVISNYSGTGITETSFIFVAYILGASFSVCLFVIEKLIRYYKENMNDDVIKPFVE
ncbi:uncharacterized protein LOC132703212 [Cylas formicarius]|uniref:uncharacterized protein LOC132703212 n=1 Tax=Cylas formicarius TaxID=197179 RepID=UPI0029584D74|nr:uncharacterized protein LOC132703212 [Cylas formicarius]